ncbi:MAG TPA: radical SAM protein [Chloroflexi bacterium]|jgi:MoaA/NifB/PqqE/SkfB family radical SAM enzyme|nr:radical SAM protein [Chloroflexota bacterium]
MIQILPRTISYSLGRLTGLGRSVPLPMNLTISPSPRCNSRCLTCNIWEKREQEMSIDEWERVLKSLGDAPYWITISGGEPFLYPHLAELARACYTHCRPAIINIPTNSLLVDRIADTVQTITTDCSETQIIINLSLDGVGARHDHIRGVPGAFERFSKTFAMLQDIARTQENLSVGIHSVISIFNVDDIELLYDYALALSPDSYITEIAEERVELATIGTGITPSADAYRRATDALLRRLDAGKFNGISRITQSFRMEYYRLVQRYLVEQRQMIPCYAGRASAQIYADGSVWPCCVRADSMGNLREADYDFGRIWRSDAAAAIRRSIHAKECACPLANAAYTNMLCHPPSLLHVARHYVDLSRRAR